MDQTDKLKLFLKNLIGLKLPLNKLFFTYEQIKFDLWKSYNLVELKKEDIYDIFNKYLKKEITSLELEKWADMVESIEAISYEEIESDNISELLFLVSNPDINGEITYARVRSLMK